MGVLDLRPLRAILAALAAVGAFGVLGSPTPTPSVTDVTEPLLGSVTYQSWDTHAATAHALEELRQWVNSTTTVPTRTEAQFFECIRWRESRGNYKAVDRTGKFRGAYQFYQGGWDTFALQVAPQWVGTPPDEAPPTIQDAVATAAYRQLGASPWNGACQ